MKTTIIISAATCLATHLALWMLGWVIWPILWVISGLLLLKLGDYLSGDEATGFGAKIVCGVLGPILLVAMIIAHLDSTPFDFSKLNLPSLPKFRNPFVWPEKNDN